ncbi:MAG: type IV pilin protein [Nitrospirota bacterium]
MSLFLKRDGLGIIDTLIICVLITIFIAVLFPYYQNMTNKAKEVALKMELVNIRMTLTLYRIMNSKYPDDIRDIIGKRYLLPIKDRTIFAEKYLIGIALDNEGYLLDPFGNRFRYDPVKGRIMSTTEQYKDW